jgi:hypothetical protein
MTFPRRLFRYCIAGVFVWFVACVGTGLYVRPLFTLCAWPVLLLHRLVPASFPDVYETAWPKLCVISLISWIVVAVLVAAVSHWASVVRKRNFVKHVSL